MLKRKGSYKLATILVISKSFSGTRSSELVHLTGLGSKEASKNNLRFIFEPSSPKLLCNFEKTVQVIFSSLLSSANLFMAELAIQDYFYD